MTHTETIQNLYAAFGRGDVAGILAHLADDVDWDNSRVFSKECPWNGAFKGKAQVPAFFEAVYGELDFSKFEPQTFIESDRHVAVVLRLESTLKRNGQMLQNDCVHVWTFNDQGKVAKYRHFNDTAQELAGWRVAEKVLAAN